MKFCILLPIGKNTVFAFLGEFNVPIPVEAKAVAKNENAVNKKMIFFMLFWP